MKQILVLGISGGLGGEVAKAFLEEGWQIVALHRNPAEARKRFDPAAPIKWIKGDALVEKDVIEAANDCSHIFHGVNPPRYRNWRELALPMLKNSIAAAHAHSARLIFPGNVYNYDPRTNSLITEETAQNPISKKGQVRCEMEELVQRAVCPTLIVRAGDFFGSFAPASWFQTVMIPSGSKSKAVTSPEFEGVGHAWAYLPDLAKTILELVNKENDLQRHDVFNFGGHYLEPGQSMATEIQKQLGRDFKIKKAPWRLIGLLSFFVPLFREIKEMKYLWEVPLKLDNSKLVAFLGQEPHTDLPSAVRRSLPDF
ncbi:sugar nucleotide-binding protein [Sneathiella limimaris]|uniref:sugar nucleotide-binding protein n=1 Tax=Sneathiella limimaris TaxID=1964213 RepID=UPI00146C4C98|nr:sugar nucleotide-binding protein [Sneathiella limimaris]